MRDFTYVDDAVEAFLLAACRPEASGRVFNLGGQGHVSLKQLAELIVAAQPKARCVNRAYPAERKKIDIGDFYSDCTLIRETLGWEPRVAVPAAVRKTLAYFRRELRHYV